MNNRGARRGGAPLGPWGSVFLAVAVWLTASGAWAYADRPDLLQLESTFVSVSTAANVNRAYVRLNQAYQDVSGKMQRTIPVGATQSSAVVGWVLYEPDKVGRTADGGKLKQSNHVWLTVQGSNGSIPPFGMSAAVAGCKAQVSVKNPAAKWKIHCDTDLLDKLGLTAEQKAVFQKVFKKNSFSTIKGSTP